MIRKFFSSMEHRAGNSAIKVRMVLNSTMKVSLTILLCSALYSTSANASCASPAGRKSMLASAQESLIQPTDMQASDPNSIEAERDDDAIVGLWHIRFLQGDVVFDEGYDQFHEDGLEVLNDNPSPGAPNGSGDVCLGVFKKVGPRTYKLRHPFWNYDGKGILIGTGVILETIIVDNHSTFHGSFVFITYNFKGVEESREVGVIKAERITAD